MKTMNQFTKKLFFFSSIILLMVSCKEQEVKKAPPIQVTVVSVLQKDVPLFREYVGQTYGVFDIPIRARVQGFLEGIHFLEGTKVHKGDHLYSIDAQPYQAKVAAQLSEIAQAKTLLVKAENDLNRYRPLAEANAVSQADLDNAVAQFDAAKAQVDAADANYHLAEIELGYTEIYSPIDGIIGKTNAKVGEFVGQTPNPVILNTVSDVSSINVEFFLNEAEYLTFTKEYIKKNEKIVQEEDKGENLELILADGSVFPYKGHIVFIDREVNSSTGSILVQARFPNPNSLLRPGQYAKVKVKITTLKDALLVPQSTVMELQGQYSVFAVGDSNKVQRMQVKVGSKDADYWVIKEGLKVTDKIILGGIQKVRNGAIVDPKEVEYKSKAPKQ
jgi:membrane fusion protein (multidrug efflux system)